MSLSLLVDAPLSGLVTVPETFIDSPCFELSLMFDRMEQPDVAVVDLHLETSHDDRATWQAHHSQHPGGRCLDRQGQPVRQAGITLRNAQRIGEDGVPQPRQPFGHVWCRGFAQLSGPSFVTTLELSWQ